MSKLPIEINQNPKQKVGKMIGFLWQLKTKGIWCASSVVFQLNNDLSTGCEKQSENKITAIVALALRFFEKLLLVVVLAAKFVYTLVVLRGASEIVYLWRAYLTGVPADAYLVQNTTLTLGENIQ